MAIVLQILKMVSIRVFFIDAKVDLIDQFQQRSAGMAAELGVLLPVVPPISLGYIGCKRARRSPHLLR